MYVMPRTESLAQGVALRHRHNSETAEPWRAGKRAPPNACCCNAVLIPGMGTPSPVSKHTALECSRASRFTGGGAGYHSDNAATMQRCMADRVGVSIKSNRSGARPGQGVKNRER